MTLTAGCNPLKSEKRVALVLFRSDLSHKPCSIPTTPFSSPPARLAILVRWDDGDVDLVGGAEQPGPLVEAQVNQRVPAEPHHASPQLQASALSVAKPLQLRHKALLVHQEAGLPHSVAQGCDLQRLAAPCNQLQKSRFG